MFHGDRISMSLPTTAFLWAQAVPQEAAAPAAGARSGLPAWSYGVWLGLGIVVVWTLLYLWERRHRWLHNAPTVGRRTLFQQLCDAQRISTADEERLEAHAQRLQLADPALLFIDPRLLESLAAADPRDQRLGVQIFGSVFRAKG